MSPPAWEWSEVAEIESHPGGLGLEPEKTADGKQPSGPSMATAGVHRKAMVAPRVLMSCSGLFPVSMVHTESVPI